MQTLVRGREDWDKKTRCQQVFGVGTEVEGVEAEVVLVGVEMGVVMEAETGAIALVGVVLEEGLSPVPSIYVYFLLGWRCRELGHFACAKSFTVTL